MGSVMSSECYSDRIVLANRLTLAGSASVIATGIALGGNHDLPNHPVRMLRIALFGGMFGAQVWNTFVNGPVLYLSVGRHTFGEVQTVLFPAYFNLSIFLSAAAIGMHVYYNPYSMWTKCERTFTLAAGINLLCNLLQSTCVLERNVSLMKKMFAIEKKAGLGQAVGSIKPDQLKDNDEYKQLRKCFGRAHGVSSLINLLALASSGIQLVYFAQHGF